MADNTFEAQKLYVAYFGRPGDVAGLGYWTNILATTSTGTQDMSASFAQSQEYRDKYAGMDNQAIVNEVYENLFGRAGDAAGVNYWAGLLNNNAITIDNVVTEISRGAQGTDSVTFNGKVAVASLFTARLDEPGEIAAYSGDTARDIAIEFIATVRDLGSAASAMDPGVVDTWIDRIVDSHQTNAALVGVQTETYSIPAF